MPSWWRDKEVSEFVGSLDETLERVGPTPEFKALLAAWAAELEALQGDGRVEVRENEG